MFIGKQVSEKLDDMDKRLKAIDEKLELLLSIKATEGPSILSSAEELSKVVKGWKDKGYIGKNTPEINPDTKELRWVSVGESWMKTAYENEKLGNKSEGNIEKLLSSCPENHHEKEGACLLDYCKCSCQYCESNRS